MSEDEETLQEFTARKWREHDEFARKEWRKNDEEMAKLLIKFLLAFLLFTLPLLW